MRGILRLFVLVSFAGATFPIAHAGDEGLEFFERKIRPALIEHCHECHSAKVDHPKGGLRLDHRAALLAGGDSGSILEPGKPEDSLLLDAISYSGAFYDMPPKGKLPEGVLADFRRWIEMGAPMPDEGGEAPVAAKAIDMEQGRAFWSFQPVREIAAPQVSKADWPRTKLDTFVLRKLEDQAIHPAAEADRRTLLRRLHFDLTGLPPGFEDIEAFVADPSPDAYERRVDMLLASPRYGERWGRHWLDVARYAEDHPTSEATCKPPRFPHPYRDWVIRALNEDLPYDEFVRRQLAADLIDGLDPADVAATGFLGLSPVYHKEPKLSQEVISVIVADEWDERLDTITRGFLGLTVACARCHDHKFDPITTRDYYALAGVMASTQLVEWPLVAADLREAALITATREQIVDVELRLSYAKAMRKTALADGDDASQFEKAAAEYEAQLKELKDRSLFDGPLANAVRDAGLWINGDDPAWTALEFKLGQSRDLPIFLRGSVTTPGEIVPRRFLEVLSAESPRPFQHGSGRLELADRIVGEAGSLAARVLVNRVWGWRFGAPLVATPSNFGQLGERPSHPELLDDLAARFIRNGWSLKWLHREISLSATYRQSSAHPDPHPADPSNRLLWRFPRKRLEAEAFRDAALAAAGELDLAMGGPSIDLDKAESRRRSVYGAVSRQRPADVLHLFDFPDAKQHAEERILTTTPLQQLYLLNSPFVQRQGAIAATQAASGDNARPPDVVRALFRVILLREPTCAEVADALELTRVDGEAAAPDPWAVLAHALLASNEFLFVD